MRNVDPDQAYIRQKEEEIRSYKDRRDRILTRACELTLVAYGLVPGGRDGWPVMPTREIQAGLMQGEGRRWVVRFGDPPDDWEIPLRGRRSARAGLTAEEKRENQASTWEDGTTVLWGEFRTPVELARLLHHELQHFEMFADKDWAEGKTRSEREAEALRRDMAVLGALGLEGPVKEYVFQRLRERKEAVEGRVAGERRWDWAAKLGRRLRRRIGVGHDAVEGSLPGLDLTREQLADIRAGAERLESRLREEDAERERLDAARRLDEVLARGQAQSRATEGGEAFPECSGLPAWAASACVARRQLERSQVSAPSVAPVLARPPVNAAPAAPASPPAPWTAPVAAPGAQPVSLPSAEEAAAALERMAAKACGQPGSVDQQELDGLGWFPSGRQASREVLDRLSGCARELYRRLAEQDRTARAGTRLNAEWVNGQARVIRRPPESDWEVGPRGRERPDADLGPCGNAGSLCGGNRPRMRP